LFRAKGLSRLERPKLLKELEDDASQLNRLSHYMRFKISNLKFQIFGALARACSE
jgi:hypothetical protein